MNSPNSGFSNADLLAKALWHLNRTVREDCPRSCAVCAFLFECLARDRGFDQTFCDACSGLSMTMREWRSLKTDQRTEIAPWLLSLEEEG